MEKVVVFDFDGTLTQKGENSWRRLWLTSGYDIGNNSAYKSLFNRYINGEFSYQEWNDRTCEYFRAGNLTSVKVSTIGALTPSIKGLKITLQELKQNGYSLFIVSGSIKQIIKSCLKDNINYFSGVYANEFVYDSNGLIQNINSTRFDFDGKKRFVELLIQNGIKPENITFVGNSYNDEKVGETGVKTICINPEETDHTDRNIWKNVVHSSTISKILPLILNKKQNYDFQK